MSYFPEEVMPKDLRRETSREVDDSPSIYNARDYNIHHREIRSIEKFLVGPDGIGGSGSGSLTGKVRELTQLLSRISNEGLLSQYAGTVAAGQRIPIPQAVTSTSTSGVVLAAATTIAVDSTTGFPSNGTITKFNPLEDYAVCSGDGLPPGGSCLSGAVQMVGFSGISSHATNQEIIAYTGKTDTSFTGCTRGVNGSTAVEAASGEPALVVSGNASLALSHNFWGKVSSNVPNQFYLSHDALLNVSAGLLEIGTDSALGGEIQDLIEVCYVLTVISDYEDATVEDLLSLFEA